MKNIYDEKLSQKISKPNVFKVRRFFGFLKVNWKFILMSIILCVIILSTVTLVLYAFFRDIDLLKHR